jgi:hypothetical protein
MRLSAERLTAEHEVFVGELLAEMTQRFKLFDRMG